jgi:hypothetical protein
MTTNPIAQDSGWGPVISIVALGFSILALGVSTMVLESVSKTPATRSALGVGDIIRRHDGKSYIVCKVWFNKQTGHWIADESPLEEL